MTNPPRTIEEARKRDLNENLCAYVIQEKWSNNYQQCPRRPGHGPANLYCKQHAKMVERSTP